MSRHAKDHVLEVLPRAFVERIAHIVGSGSAAAQALACADRGDYGDNPVFCRPVTSRGSIIVTARANLTAEGAAPMEAA